MNTGAPSLWTRIKEHKLVQTALAYFAASVAVAHAEELIAHAYGWPEIVQQILIGALAVGFPVALGAVWLAGRERVRAGKPASRRLDLIVLVLLALLIAALIGERVVFGLTEEESRILLIAVGILVAVLLADRLVLPRRSQERAAPEPAALGIAAATATAGRLEPPSIAFLPLTNLTGDPAFDAIADGLTEDLITGFAQGPGFRVAARNSSFKYRGATDVRETGRALGADYIAEGSLQKQGSGLKFTLQIIDAETGAHLRADSIVSADGNLDAFRRQYGFTADSAAQRIHEAIVPHWLSKTGTSDADVLAQRLPPEALPLVGWWWIRRADRPFAQRWAEVQMLMQKGVELRPENPWAHALCAMQLAVWLDGLFRWLGPTTGGVEPPSDPSAIFRQILEHIDRALGPHELSTGLLNSISWILSRLGYLKRARPMSERCLREAPYPFHRTLSAWCKLAIDSKIEEVIAEVGGWLERDRFLSPLEQVQLPLILSFAHLIAGNASRAVALLEPVAATAPNDDTVTAALVTAYTAAGKPKQARQLADEVEVRRPDGRLVDNPLRRACLHPERSGIDEDSPAGRFFLKTMPAALRAVGLDWALPPEEAGPGVKATVAQAKDTSDERVSLAVLPFADMSPGKDQEYFSDGLSEELLNQLAQMKGLRVAARTSCFAFKGQNPDLRQVSEKLGVGHVLEGSVRKAGNRLRITAQLINASDGYHLWSNTFDRELDDVFAIQEDIARAVAEALKITLGMNKSTLTPGGTKNIEAYDLYLRGIAQMYQGNPDGFQRAAALLREAVDRDPRFAMAWATLSAAYFNSVAWSFDDATIEDLMTRADEAVERAKACAPELETTYALQCAQAMFGRGDWLAAQAALDKAVELAPSGMPYLRISRVFLSRVGRTAEAIESSRLIVRSDPLAPEMEVPFTLDCAGRYDEAETEYKRQLTLSADPTVPEYWAFLRALAREGSQTAKLQLRRYLALEDPNTPYLPIHAEVLAKFDNKQAVLALLRGAFDDPAYRNPARMQGLAFLAAYFGDEALALACLRFAFVGKRDGPLRLIAIWHPLLASLRKTEGFKQLVRDLGLYDYWRQSGHWPDFARPNGDGDFEMIK